MRTRLYKHITMFSLSILSLQVMANFPEICHEPGFVCHQSGPNSVNVYPVSNKEPPAVQRQNEQKKNIFTGISEKNTIEVDLENLTWAAFDEKGEMVRQGRASGGKEYCPDIKQNCETVTGTFTIFRKGDEDCKSTRFPVGRGGAPMPYCMFFHGGYALHGSYAIPDYNASHGCVRIEPAEAQWLNENFVEVGKTRITIHY